MKPQRSNGFLFRIQNKQSYLGPCSYISINLHIYITIFLSIYLSFYKYICFLFIYISNICISLSSSFVNLSAPSPSSIYLFFFLSFYLFFSNICMSFFFLSLLFSFFLSLYLSSISSFLLSCASVLKHISWPHLSAFYSA